MIGDWTLPSPKPAPGLSFLGIALLNAAADIVLPPGGNGEDVEILGSDGGPLELLIDCSNDGRLEMGFRFMRGEGGPLDGLSKRVDKGGNSGEVRSYDGG